MGKKQQGKGQKRSKRDKPSRTRYRNTFRRDTNKVSKMKRYIRKLERILKKNPEAKVKKVIDHLKDRIKKWENRRYTGKL
jgi:hypothetical protein